jgi:homoserine O-acetyltransferase
MKNLKKFNAFFGLCLIVLLVWSRLASAGVPSPVPDAAVGPEVQIANLGDFKFENGEVVKDFKVSYVTHGKLNEKKDNIILVMHGSWGDHHEFDFLIGPGNALDTDEYFIVAPDRLGNPALRQNITTGPTNSGLKMDFPRYTIRDSVNAEYRLLKEYLGFDHILAAIGVSMGGMEAYQFGVSYPTYMSGLIPMGATPVAGPHLRTIKTNLNEIIELDSGWHGGKYETNPLWAVTTMLWNFRSWAFTPQWFTANLKREEAYRQWDRMWDDINRSFPQDARDWYYTNQAETEFSVGDTPGFNGDVKAALESIQARVLIIGAKSDIMFPREEIISAKNGIPNATHIELDSTMGHISLFGWEPESAKIIGREISKFLSNLAAGAQ